MSIDAKLVTVVQAIKQSIEQSAGPGVSVNSHPNPFFLSVNGALDLKHAAELILTRLEAFEVAAKARAEAEIQKVLDDAAAAAKAVEAKIKATL
jgi:hypothetical protein